MMLCKTSWLLADPSQSLLVFEPCIACDVMQTDCILLISVLNACMNHILVPPMQRSISRICQGLAELGWISWRHFPVLPLKKSMANQELQGDNVSVARAAVEGQPSLEQDCWHKATSALSLPAGQAGCGPRWGQQGSVCAENPPAPSFQAGNGRLMDSGWVRAAICFSLLGCSSQPALG